MDALLKLRVLIWVLVVSLWGLMVYQYLGEEEREAAKMQAIVNPYIREPAPPAPVPDEAALAALNAPASAPVAVLAPQPAAPPPGTPRPIADDPAARVLPAPEAVGPAPSTDRRPPAAAQPPVAARPQPAPRRRVQEDRSALPDPPLPPGFAKRVTRHFNVYSEQYPASDRFVELIEALHGNLMLDLAPFSPWAKDQRVTIYLFKSQQTYRQVTGRPSWSGGASSVPKRKVYVYESEELPGILAHELTHIYFDAFFIDGVANPLWLSEGMATLVQVERGLAAPNWLRDNLEILERGGGIPIESFMAVSTTSGWNDDRVRLWYAQAYSVVRFMIRTQYRSSFYKFSANLRDGQRADEALYRAYGAPYNRLKALEYAWRYELTRNSTVSRVP
ncbi:MAG: hypothetical protein SF051_13265 [Elusimicrobiota bacterium]|nr:hypothetical protein [Elusimicrobiota bacterium]